MLSRTFTMLPKTTCIRKLATALRMLARTIRMTAYLPGIASSFLDTCTVVNIVRPLVMSSKLHPCINGESVFFS